MRKSSVSPLLYEAEMEEKWREKNGGILMEEKWSAQMEGKWREIPPFSLHLCTPFFLHLHSMFPPLKSLHFFPSIFPPFLPRTIMEKGSFSSFSIIFFGSSIFPPCFLHFYNGGKMEGWGSLDDRNSEIRRYFE